MVLTTISIVLHKVGLTMHWSWPVHCQTAKRGLLGLSTRNVGLPIHWVWLWLCRAIAYKNIEMTPWYSMVMAPTIQMIQRMQKKQYPHVLPGTHTIHIFQPLDMVLFHPLKAHFYKLTQNLKLVRYRWKEPINCCKINFTKLFKEPWESMTVMLIKTVFWKYGIFLLRRGAMDTSRLSSNSSNPLPPSANTSNPNPPLSADENTSLITVLTQVRKYLNHRA